MKWIVFAITVVLIPVLLNGQEVETLTIGNQIWMKRNLNIHIDSSYCFNHEPANCGIFGRLYDWESAINACPEGFRLPSDEDWQTLIEFVGGANIAGYKLMAGGETGFDVLMGGNYNAFSDIFSYQFRQAYFWSSTPFSETAAWMRHFINEKTNVNRSTVKKHYFFSVRCIRN